MDIFDFMDCEDCPYYRFHRGRTGGDPGDCYPEEAECLDGDFGNDHPCGRMLGAIGDMIRDGMFESDSGFLASREFLADCTATDLEDLGFSMEEPPVWWNDGKPELSSAAYYYISNDTDVHPVAYKDEKSVYAEFFA
jgi:hypothetical protein